MTKLDDWLEGNCAEMRAALAASPDCPTDEVEERLAGYRESLSRTFTAERLRLSDQWGITTRTILDALPPWLRRRLAPKMER